MQDGILDRTPPVTLLENNVSVPLPPSMPYLSWRITLDDTTLGYTVEPAGSAWHQLIMYILMLIIPPLTATLAIILFRKSFYGVKHNYVGVADKMDLYGAISGHFKLISLDIVGWWAKVRGNSAEVEPAFMVDDPLAGDVGAPNRRKVLIATMEYEIEDWAIKIKIGGLGVMASLSESFATSQL